MRSGEGQFPQGRQKDRHGPFHRISRLAKRDPTLKWPKDKRKKEISKRLASRNRSHQATGKQKTSGRGAFPSLPRTVNHRHGAPALRGFLLKTTGGSAQPSEKQKLVVGN